MTDSFEAAVARVQYQLQREELVYSPPLAATLDVDDGINDDQGGAADFQARPKIDPERERYEHQSSVPEIVTNEDEILREWGGLNNPKFYGAVRASLKIARDTKHPDNEREILKLDKLINSYGQHSKVKTLIDKYVRVKAIKAKGASSGTGLDELFKTSETMKYLERKGPERTPSSIARVAPPTFARPAADAEPRPAGAARHFAEPDMKSLADSLPIRFTPRFQLGPSRDSVDLVAHLILRND